MVQQPRQEQPLYSCVIPVDSLTGRPDEELMIFGVSVEDVENQAKELLIKDYGCNEDVIPELMQKARIESLSPWCSPSNSQGDTSE